MSSSKRIGILGAGRAGTAFARAAARAGIDVQIASTRTPNQMRYHLMQYAPQAAGVLDENIADGVDIVILAVPQEDLADVEPQWVADKILIDATNRWEDEPLPDWLEEGITAGRSSSEVLGEYFRSSIVVKALNHISHWAMDAPRDNTVLRAVGVATDDEHAASCVANLVSSLGFLPVIADSLAAGRALEPGSKFFNVVATEQQLAEALQE